MVAERLRNLRRERNQTKRDLVAQLPLNYSTYANYESGFREPNSEVLQLMAGHFGVSIDYLLGVSDNRKKADEVAILNDDEHEHIMKYRQLDGHGREVVEVVMLKEYERAQAVKADEAQESKLRDGLVELPVYQQRASAGLGNYLSDDSDDDYEIMQFESTQVSRGADFCITIKGDSMEPKICDNDIVFVKAVPRIDPDSVGIFVYDGEAYCKRLRVDYEKGAIYLESLNKAFASKEIDQPENLRTVGLVIGIAERG
ncbi:MAG: LexA family transcriptional regulator [Defluviitaleaceae bacterium]|nr:LexA family transcriptional regulator [Defluviitaleaceae bacterium]